MEKWKISMVKVGASVLATALIVVLAFVMWPPKPDAYEAKCVYAYWKSDVTTNATGEVVQPNIERRVGTYKDYLRVAEEDLMFFLSQRERRSPLIGEYLSSRMNDVGNAEAVSNVFAKIRYKVSGAPIAVVDLSVEAESRELALDVIKFAIDRYLAHVQENETFREEKAVATIRAQTIKNQQRGEEESDFADRLERARCAARQYRDKVTIIQCPFVRSVKR